MQVDDSRALQQNSAPRRMSVLMLLLAIAALTLVWTASAATTRVNESQVSIDGLTVGYMTITPIDQGSWDPQEYAAFRKMANAHRWKVRMAQTVPASQAQQVLTGFVSAGASLVFVTSQTYEPAVRAVAAKFPKTKFFVMDAVSKRPLANQGAYTPNWYELGYLGGAAAGLITKTNKIGLITGLPLDASAQAFGTARVGARKFAPKAQTLVSYTNDWLDPAKGASAAKALISKGVDVTFSIAGPMQPAILRADAENDAYGIGLYTDERKFAPGAVPTSVLLKWDVAYKHLAQRLTAGTWKPGVFQLTIANGGLGTTPFKGVSGAATKTKKLNALKAAIRSGKIKVPHIKLKG